MNQFTACRVTVLYTTIELQSVRREGVMHVCEGVKVCTCDSL